MHIKLKCWRGGIVLGMKIVWGGRNHVLCGGLESVDAMNFGKAAGKR